MSKFELIKNGFTFEHDQDQDSINTDELLMEDIIQEDQDSSAKNCGNQFEHENEAAIQKSPETRLPLADIAIKEDDGNITAGSIRDRKPVTSINSKPQDVSIEVSKSPQRSPIEPYKKFSIKKERILREKIKYSQESLKLSNKANIELNCNDSNMLKKLDKKEEALIEEIRELNPPTFRQNKKASQQKDFISVSLKRKIDICPYQNDSMSNPKFQDLSYNTHCNDNSLSKSDYKTADASNSKYDAFNRNTIDSTCSGPHMASVQHLSTADDELHSEKKSRNKDCKKLREFNIFTQESQSKNDEIINQDITYESFSNSRSYHQLYLKKKDYGKRPRKNSQQKAIPCPQPIVKKVDLSLVQDNNSTPQEGVTYQPLRNATRPKKMREALPIEASVVKQTESIKKNLEICGRMNSGRIVKNKSSKNLSKPMHSKNIQTANDSFVNQQKIINELLKELQAERKKKSEIESQNKHKRSNSGFIQKNNHTTLPLTSRMGEYLYDSSTLDNDRSQVFAKKNSTCVNPPSCEKSFLNKSAINMSVNLKQEVTDFRKRYTRGRYNQLTKKEVIQTKYSKVKKSLKIKKQIDQENSKPKAYNIRQQEISKYYQYQKKLIDSQKFKVRRNTQSCSKIVDHSKKPLRRKKDINTGAEKELYPDVSFNIPNIEGNASGYKHYEPFIDEFQGQQSCQMSNNQKEIYEEWVSSQTSDYDRILAPSDFK
ncbi:unnamed protein product [Moneuplotes crassus]|uniref:Uncharacterized protein n=1 Tax=Euplotes crassus TaxID=5936 RepID=A0AAD1Y841_EUPCR|nr:unnamed protein product [Moneuplotes crassus]